MCAEVPLNSGPLGYSDLSLVRPEAFRPCPVIATVVSVEVVAASIIQVISSIFVVKNSCFWIRSMP